MEEGNDPIVTVRTNQSRVFPHRLLQLLVAFLLLCLAFSVVSIYTIRYSGVQSAVPTVLQSFKPCVEELTSLEGWIRPPSNLLHTMTDKELFWRASYAPRIKKYPFARVPKIAFMFLTKGPLPLAPLWERFFKGHDGLYSIYIHSLPSFQADFPSSSVFYNRRIPSQIDPNLIGILFVLKIAVLIAVGLQFPSATYLVEPTLVSRCPPGFLLATVLS
ncbi:hypothetical protein U1Q18_045322 [Sarracenia purpurea var. burkii]